MEVCASPGEVHKSWWRLSLTSAAYILRNQLLRGSVHYKGSLESKVCGTDDSDQQEELPFLQAFVSHVEFSRAKIIKNERRGK